MIRIHAFPYWKCPIDFLLSRHLRDVADGIESPTDAKIALALRQSDEMLQPGTLHSLTHKYRILLKHTCLVSFSSIASERQFLTGKKNDVRHAGSAGLVAIETKQSKLVQLGAAYFMRLASHDAIDPVSFQAAGKALR